MVAIGPPSPWFAAGDPGAPFPVELVAPPAASPPPPARVRVITFNVESRTRTARLVDALRAHPELRRADLLLLQEIGPHRDDAARAARVAGALGLGHAHAHGLAILSRWPLADVAVMELPHARLPYNRRRRAALSAAIELAGGPVRVTTVHLDTRLDAGERLRQLVPAVDRADPRQLVGGDVNTLPFRFAGGAVPIGRADQAGQLDAYMRERGFATPVAGAGATHRNVLGVRLDAVFTRGLAPAPAQVARDVRVSDHFPVWLDVEA